MLARCLVLRFISGDWRDSGAPARVNPTIDFSKKNCVFKRLNISHLKFLLVFFQRKTFKNDFKTKFSVVQVLRDVWLGIQNEVTDMVPALPVTKLVRVTLKKFARVIWIVLKSLCFEFSWKNGSFGSNFGRKTVIIFLLESSYFLIQNCEEVLCRSMIENLSPLI